MGYRFHYNPTTKLMELDTGLVLSDSLVAPNMPGHNLVINGDSLIAVRGSQTGVGGSATNYGAPDRFLVYTIGSPQARATVSQESGVFAGFGYSTKIDCTTAEGAVAAGEVWSWQTRIEANQLQHLLYGAAGAKTLALRFKIKSPKSGTHCVALYQPDGTRSYIREFSVTTADTEQEITVAFPGDASGTINNDTGEGLRLTWPLIAGLTYQATKDAWATGEDYATSGQQNLLDNTANNFEVTGIQLELGSESTPFEHRKYGAEFDLCRRYYRRIGQGIQGWGYGLSTTQAIMIFRLYDEMRIVPAGALVSGVVANDARLNDTVSNYTPSSAAMTSFVTDRYGGKFFLNNYTGLTQHRPIFIDPLTQGNAIIQLDSEFV